MLLTQHPAQAPHHCLGGVGDRVGRSGGHRAPGQQPERRRHIGVTQCLHQRHRGSQPTGHSRVYRVSAAVQRGQGQHTTQLDGLVGDGVPQGARERAAINILVVDRDQDDVRSGVGEHAPGPVQLSGGTNGQPGAGQRRGRGFGERLPADPVPQPVHSGLLLLLGPPCCQRGQDLGQRTLIDRQVSGQRGRVGTVHSSPEASLS